MNTSSPLFVWDLHTRLFHWLLVILISVSFATGLYGDMDWMDWHIRCGYGLLGLMFFRLYTGLIGRDYGRFSHFQLSPRAALRYVRGQQAFNGHNPLGSWMVVAMLCAISAQILSGLLTTDDYFFEGPWVYWFDEEWVSLGGSTHHLVWQFLAGFIGLHIAAVLFYQFVKKDKLVNAMITGRKESANGTNGEAQNITPLPFWGLLLLAGLAGGSAWALIQLPSWLF
ncbi:cytochrome b/b6 domain-containing protein [Pseudomaricurvus sp.]|uniref:cytochrome b/b6 domain-containing protein n=1 Tax=Pseudomaricurvus sp. TaxID=2004510 RepID=UPI003F6D0299